MNQHPVMTLDSVYRWLDYVLATYGLEIYMVPVWLSPFLIAWILRGGFWSRSPQRRCIRRALPVIPVAKATPPPLPPIVAEKPDRQAEEDVQSFAI